MSYFDRVINQNRLTPLLGLASIQVMLELVIQI